MIVISDSLLIDESGDYNANSPFIGYKNEVGLTNIASTTADANFPVTNLANPATHLLWKGTGVSTTEYVTVTLPGTVDVDYAGIARHNFGTAGLTVELQTNTGGVWTTQASLIPTTDDPIVFRFPADAYDGVRLKLTVGSTAPIASVMFVGESMLLQRRIYVGHTPITLGRRYTSMIGRSQSGNFLGRILIGEDRKSAIAMKNLTPGWYREDFDAFVTAVKDKTFFFAWRPSSYPLEVGYVWLNTDVMPTNQLANGMMQVDLDISGVA